MINTGEGRRAKSTPSAFTLGYSIARSCSLFRSSSWIWREVKELNKSQAAWR